MKHIFILLFGLSLLGSTSAAFAQLSLVSFHKTTDLGGYSRLKCKEQKFTYFDKCQSFEIRKFQRTIESDNLKQKLINQEKQRVINEKRRREMLNATNFQTDVQQNRARLRANCYSKLNFSKITNAEELIEAQKHPEYLECRHKYRAETRQMADWY